MGQWLWATALITTTVNSEKTAHGWLKMPKNGLAAIKPTSYSTEWLHLLNTAAFPAGCNGLYSFQHS